MYELNEVSLGDNDLPVICWDVNHCSEKFQHQVCVLATLLHHHGVVFQVLDESFMALRVELGDVTDAFEKKSVAELGRTGDHLVQLTVSRKHLCVSLVRS